MSTLEDRVVLMSGGSRGIGLAIAKKVAAEGAKVAIMAKTDQPHPKLPGTIHTAAAEIEEAGGEALAILGDVRDDAQVEAAAAQALPHLRESDHAHVLTLSPPLSTDPRWLAGHAAYTLSKMGMTMITLGLAADEAEAGIAANCLWPRTIIATAAVQNLPA